MTLDDHDDGDEENHQDAINHRSSSARPYHPFEINTVNRRFAHAPGTTTTPTAFSSTSPLPPALDPTKRTPAASFTTTNRQDIDRIIQRGFGVSTADRERVEMLPYEGKRGVPEWGRLQQRGVDFREPQFVARTVCMSGFCCNVVAPCQSYNTFRIFRLRQVWSRFSRVLRSLTPVSDLARVLADLWRRSRGSDMQWSGYFFYC